MVDHPGSPFFGNVTDVGQATRGWFLGHFMPGDDHPLRSSDVELTWYTHARGETRTEWSPAHAVRTLNVLTRGTFVLVFPDREAVLATEADFVLFGPDVAHSFRAVEESLVLTARWPSRPS